MHVCANQRTEPFSEAIELFATVIIENMFHSTLIV